MEEKIQVKCVSPIRYHEDSVKIGDIGYIDGYMNADVPYVICIFGKNIVLSQFHNLEVLTK